MTIRRIYLLGFLIITALLSTSLYLQFYDNIMPCPLCSLQRLAFCLLGITFLLGIVFVANKAARLIINCFALIFSLAGLLFAGRQIWLQHFPAAGNECGVSLQYMMQVLPMNMVIQKVFEGSAECTQRGWEFLSLNMAEWALIWFALFLLVSLYLVWKEIRN